MNAIAPWLGGGVTPGILSVTPGILVREVLYAWHEALLETGTLDAEPFLAQRARHSVGLDGIPCPRNAAALGGWHGHLRPHMAALAALLPSTVRAFAPLTMPFSDDTDGLIPLGRYRLLEWVCRESKGLALTVTQCENQHGLTVWVGYV